MKAKDKALIEGLEAIDPVRGEDLDGAEGALAQGMLRGILASDEAGPALAPRSRPKRRRGFALAGAVAAVAAAILVAASSGRGPGGETEPALGAGLARLVKVSPPILLRAPGWRVESAEETSPARGSTRFYHGAEAAELRWGPDSLSARERAVRARGAALLTTAAALGTEARVFTRLNRSHELREAIALFEHRGRVLEFRSRVSDTAAFRARLAALRDVETGTWIEALPPKIVSKPDSDSGADGWEAVIAKPSPRPRPKSSPPRREVKKENR